MRHGFVKVAAATPDIRVADVAYNVEQIKKQMDEADEQGAKVVVFPELCLTGYTCGDSVEGSEGRAKGVNRVYERKRRTLFCRGSGRG